MIEGLIKTPLKQIQDERGKVMHMLRETDPYFKRFGEIYFSWIYAGATKAWTKHKEATLNYAVPVGVIRIVLFDDRPGSSTYKLLDEYILSNEDYFLLTIPPNIYYGFQSLGQQSALIVNCSTLPHDPSESVKLPFNSQEIPYGWES